MTTPTNTPPSFTPLAEGKSVSVALADVARIAELLISQGELEAFMDAATKADAFVSLQAPTVNFIKNYVASHPNLYGTELGAKILNAEHRAPPASRNFGQGDDGCYFGKS